MSTASPPKPPPPKSANKPLAATQVASRPVAASRGVMPAAHKVVIYGPGGCGKSSLCASLRDVGINPLFIDAESGSFFLDVDRRVPETFDDVRSILHDTALIDPFGAVVIESLTKVEEMALTWTLANVPKEGNDGKKTWVTSIEGYGWGKGMMHLYESFLPLLGDLDAIVRSGRHVICTAHDCTASVPNPGGDDWIRYEPRLQSPTSGKASIRHRIKEWCDHLLYIGYDKIVSDGKAQGTGGRTIYPCEMPTYWAKSRMLQDEIIYTRGDSTLWQQLFAKDKP